MHNNLLEQLRKDAELIPECIRERDDAPCDLTSNMATYPSSYSPALSAVPRPVSRQSSPVLDARERLPTRLVTGHRQGAMSMPRVIAPRSQSPQEDVSIRGGPSSGNTRSSARSLTPRLETIAAETWMDDTAVRHLRHQRQSSPAREGLNSHVSSTRSLPSRVPAINTEMDSAGSLLGAASVGLRDERDVIEPEDCVTRNNHASTLSSHSSILGSIKLSPSPYAPTVEHIPYQSATVVSIEDGSGSRAPPKVRVDVRSMSVDACSGAAASVKAPPLRASVGGRGVDLDPSPQCSYIPPRVHIPAQSVTSPTARHPTPQHVPQRMPSHEQPSIVQYPMPVDQYDRGSRPLSVGQKCLAPRNVPVCGGGRVAAYAPGSP